VASEESARIRSVFKSPLRRSSSLALASIAALAAILALPTGAQAAVSCTFNTGVLAVQVTAGSPNVTLQRNGSDIEVLEGLTSDEPPPTPAACTGGTPTVTTTSSIQMNDIGSSQDTDFNFELAAGPLEPGIEVTADGGDDGPFGDELTLIGGEGADNWHFGALSGTTNGVNLNAPETAGPDGDDIAMTGIEDLQVFSDPVLGSIGGDDQLLANGGTGFTGPFPMPAQMTGSEGDDLMVAGSGDTYLGGDDDDDTMIGGPGNDELRLSTGTPGGNDVAFGGGGTDNCTYFNQDGNVTADLRIATQQDTGAGGLDTFAGCEDLEGGDGNDLLIGTSGANLIDGGTRGSDTGADTLVGLAGTDTLVGVGGADALNVRDGGPDIAVCGAPTPGPPLDVVTADQQGVDAINADCEQVLFAAPPAPASTDTTAPDTTIKKGPKRKTRKRNTTIAFSASEAGSRFECSLDGKPFAACQSPFTKKVKRRRHSFQVRAIDQAGNTDATPALLQWRVRR
jgi:hypothetical protein